MDTKHRETIWGRSHSPFGKWSKGATILPVSSTRAYGALTDAPSPPFLMSVQQKALRLQGEVKLEAALHICTCRRATLD